MLRNPGPRKGTKEMESMTAQLTWGRPLRPSKAMAKPSPKTPSPCGPDSRIYRESIDPESKPASTRQQANIGTGLQHPIGPSLEQHRRSHRRGKPHNPRAGCFPRSHARGYVLHYDASRRRKTQLRCPFDVGIRMGLAVRDVVRRDESLWQRQPSRADANFCQGTGARSHNRPAIRGQAREQIQRTRQRDHPLQILDLTPLHFAVFRIVIRAWKVFLDGGQAGTAMSPCHDFLRVESALDRPAPPYARHRRSGVDENSVHVEEQSVTLNLNHVGNLAIVVLASAWSVSGCDCKRASPPSRQNLRLLPCVMKRNSFAGTGGSDRR